MASPELTKLSIENSPTTVPSQSVPPVPGTPNEQPQIDLSFMDNISPGPSSKIGQTAQEQRSEPTVVSSDLARSDFETEQVKQTDDRTRMMDQLDMAEKQLKELQKTLDARKDNAPDTSQDGEIFTDQERAALGLDQAQPTEEDRVNERITSLNSQAEADISEIEAAFSRAEAMVDASTRAQVNQIKSVFRQMENEQRKANERALESYKNFGIRIGAARYAGEINQGVINAETRAGMERLESIANAMASAIAGAESAGADKKYTLFLEQRQELAKQREEYRKELEQLRVQAFESRQKAQEQFDKMDRQSRIAEVLSTGTRNPIDVFTQLNGTVPFDEIKEIMDELPEEQKVEQFTLGSMDIRFDDTGKVIARGSKVGGGGTTTGGVGLGGALSVGSPSGVVGPPTISGLGNSYDTSNLEAQLVIDDIVNGLPTQLINNVAEIPRWREAVRKQLSAGYTEQQVIDKLSGFRLFSNADKSLGTTLYNLSVGSDVTPQDLAGLLNRGANVEAMNKVENSQLEKVDSFFSSVDKARSTVKQADTVLKMLEDPSFPIDKLGIFDAAVFKFKRAADMTSAEEVKVQQLESALQLLNAPIRVEIVGTAATEAEMSKITGFQASISSQPDIVETQVKELRDAVLRFHNEARAQRSLPTVNSAQLLDNEQRLNLYKDVSTINDEVVNSSLSNYDFLSHGAWSGYEPTEMVKGQSNSDFFNNY